MLPTTGDRVAAARPDRAGPTASDVLPAPRSAPAAARVLITEVVITEVPRATTATVPLEALQALEPPAAVAPADEPQGCLYALSQPPLMLFLLVIGSLLGLGAAYDLIFV
ncbi:hypothetical protein [Streptomyces sp. NBC_01198]|uniref:hypothetical protein n=1 Tax=Streptomyces sp. NBC_01198 TaxID=2903769 RepID=UPI002E0E6017|nr:hypothetical protein OG702_29940 [Streptomyces sp. NBC_01198]